VTGITKPNADIKGITMSLHLLDNLTKKTWLYSMVVLKISVRMNQ
jgi:hypothetical protein